VTALPRTTIPNRFPEPLSRTAFLNRFPEPFFP